MDSNTVLKEGYLKKEGVLSSKKLWFSLSATTIAYYESAGHKGKNVKGVIPLNSISSCEQKKDKAVVSIRTHSRCVNLRSDTAEQSRAWCEAINKAIKKKHGSALPNTLSSFPQTKKEIKRPQATEVTLIDEKEEEQDNNSPILNFNGQDIETKQVRVLEKKVDTQLPHFKIYFCPSSQLEKEEEPDLGAPVALLGLGSVLPPSSSDSKRLRASTAGREGLSSSLGLSYSTYAPSAVNLEVYHYQGNDNAKSEVYSVFVEKGFQLSYVLYHCSSAQNVKNDYHWVWFPLGDFGPPYCSLLIKTVEGRVIPVCSGTSTMSVNESFHKFQESHAGCRLLFPILKHQPTSYSSKGKTSFDIMKDAEKMVKKTLEWKIHKLMAESLQSVEMMFAISQGMLQQLVHLDSFEQLIIHTSKQLLAKTYMEQGLLIKELVTKVNEMQQPIVAGNQAKFDALKLASAKFESSIEHQSDMKENALARLELGLTRVQLSTLLEPCEMKFNLIHTTCRAYQEYENALELLTIEHHETSALKARVHVCYANGILEEVSSSNKEGEDKILSLAKAISQFDKALSIVPSSPEALFGRSVALRLKSIETKNESRAMELLNQSLADCMKLFELAKHNLKTLPLHVKKNWLKSQISYVLLCKRCGCSVSQYKHVVEHMSALVNSVQEESSSKGDADVNQAIELINRITISSNMFKST